MKRTFKQHLNEVYSRQNKWFLDYMKAKDLDLYNMGWLAQQWLEQEDLEAEEVFGKDIDWDEYDEAGDALENMPENYRKSFTEYASEYLMQNDPAEAPTWAHMDLNKKTLLPRTTWLLHFSNDADSIWEDGFKYGAQDMDKLGLTTYYKDSHRKMDTGYNFAFLATGRHAARAARDGKYGSDCVIFQNSGVEAHHYGDEEDQIVFWGENAHPSGMALIVKGGDDYYVKANRNWKENKEYIFTGDFGDCVNWVIQNWSRYSRVLHGG